MNTSQRPPMGVILELTDIGATLEGEPKGRKSTTTLQNTPLPEWDRSQNTKISRYSMVASLRQVT